MKMPFFNKRGREWALAAKVAGTCLWIGLATVWLGGCNVSPHNASVATTPPTSTTPPIAFVPPTYSGFTSLSRPSILVGQNGWSPSLVFSATSSGMSTPYMSLEGCLPAVDGSGNVYLAVFHYPWGCDARIDSIDVYSSTSGQVIRSLPVGSGTIAGVKDMAVSPAGEIFVNDGSGIAVFSPTANGSDAPVRYIQWNGGETAPVTPGYIAVDNKDNLYVQNGLSIAVFGPSDNGSIVPSRVIGGPHTQFGTALGRMTTDVQGNLYVTCECYGISALEFAKDANGDVAPLRYVTSPDIWNFSGDREMGVAVDSSGLIYIRGTHPYCGATFVFAADASGSTTPLRVIDDGAAPCYDIDGTIALF
jgi:hypothetical protein